jgi:hypothetical protein
MCKGSEGTEGDNESWGNKVLIQKKRACSSKTLDLQYRYEDGCTEKWLRKRNRV